MVKKIKSNLSNRSIYSLITLAIFVVAIGVVFATAPNPGHDSDEISFEADSIPLIAVDADLCQSDGTGCLPSTPTPGLYISDTGDLCWSTEAPNACQAYSTPCMASNVEMMEYADCEGDASYARNENCANFCLTKVGCKGDLTPFICGASDANYNTGVFDSCGTGVMYCICSGTGDEYSKEIAYNPTGKRCAVIQ